MGSSRVLRQYLMNSQPQFLILHAGRHGENLPGIQHQLSLGAGQGVGTGHTLQGLLQGKGGEENFMLRDAEPLSAFVAILVN